MSQHRITIRTAFHTDLDAVFDVDANEAVCGAGESSYSCHFAYSEWPAPSESSSFFETVPACAQQLIGQLESESPYSIGGSNANGSDFGVLLAKGIESRLSKKCSVTYQGDVG
jgi:hypothetical protein